VLMLQLLCNTSKADNLDANMSVATVYICKPGRFDYG